MKIKENTTIVDTAFNLYGSLTGIPAILRQLPVGERIGFDTLPEMGEDVADIGQTWTPDLAGKDVDIKVDKIYNTLGVAKAPYSTDLYRIGAAVRYGEDLIETFLPPDTTEYENMYPMNLNKWTKYALVGKNAQIVNGYLRVYSSDVANSYYGSGFFKDAINARIGKPFKFSFDIRSGAPRLVDGENSFTVTAGSASSAFYNLTFNVPVKAGDVFRISVAQIRVLAGSPDRFAVAVFNSGITNPLSVAQYLTATDRVVELLISDGVAEQTGAKLIVYAGVPGATAGNKVEFTDVRCYDPDVPVPSRARIGLVYGQTNAGNPPFVNTGPIFQHYEFDVPNMAIRTPDFYVSKVYTDSVDGFFEVRNIKVTQYI